MFIANSLLNVKGPPLLDPILMPGKHAFEFTFNNFPCDLMTEQKYFS